MKAAISGTSPIKAIFFSSLDHAMPPKTVSLYIFDTFSVTFKLLISPDPDVYDAQTSTKISLSLSFLVPFLNLIYHFPVSDVEEQRRLLLLSSYGIWLRGYTWFA